MRYVRIAYTVISDLVPELYTGVYDVPENIPINIPCTRNRLGRSCKRAMIENARYESGGNEGERRSSLSNSLFLIRRKNLHSTTRARGGEHNIQHAWMIFCPIFYKLCPNLGQFPLNSKRTRPSSGRSERWDWGCPERSANGSGAAL